MNLVTVSLNKEAKNKEDVLSDLRNADQSEVHGGKAVGLCHALRLGLNVPRGFVIPDPIFKQFLEDNDLYESMNIARQISDWETPGKVQQVSCEIRQKIMASSLEASWLADLNGRIQNLFPKVTLVVRSSAVGEDAEQASFAGQLDSILNIQSPKQLEQAILACWASYWSERVLLYQLHKRVYLQGMAVIVQEQIDSRFSGVLFTRDPDHSETQEAPMRLEYCLGLADQLVSGEVHPGHISISSEGFSWEEVERPEQKECVDELDGLNEKTIKELQVVGQILEQERGGPQDIEWTLDKNRTLFVLQSRPITHLGRPEKGGSSVCWSNANVNENFPEPVTPFLYSFVGEGYYHYFRNLGLSLGMTRERVAPMESSLQNLIGVHGGRLYYNLSNIHKVLQWVPFGNRLVEAFDQFVGAEPIAGDTGGSALNFGIRKKIKTILEGIRIALWTAWQYMFVARRIRAFEKIVDRFCENSSPAFLKNEDLESLNNKLIGFLEIRFRKWNNAALADAAAMVCYWSLQKILSREFSQASQANIHNSLLKGLPNLVSNQPIIELWNLAQKINANVKLRELFFKESSGKILIEIKIQQRYREFKESFDSYLDHWGFRKSGELMLTVPSFQENPEETIEILKTYLKSAGRSPMDTLRGLEEDRILKTREVLREIARNPVCGRVEGKIKSFFVRILLKATHGSIALRERARLKQALLYSRLRYIVLALGEGLVCQGQIKKKEDIFFLGYREINNLISGREFFPERIQDLIDLRKEEHQKLSLLNPPDAFQLPFGDYYSEKLSPPLKTVINGNEKVLKGAGACSGSITSKAALLQNSGQVSLLSHGDILVTRQTDPGWGPIFYLIKGLVIERGGMLSHGAILAREFGIPTVVGVKDAMKKIKSSETLLVDGDQGIVQIID